MEVNLKQIYLFFLMSFTLYVYPQKMEDLTIYKVTHIEKEIRLFNTYYYIFLKDKIFIKKDLLPIDSSIDYNTLKFRSFDKLSSILNKHERRKCRNRITFEYDNKRPVFVYKFKIPAQINYNTEKDLLILGFDLDRIAFLDNNISELKRIIELLL